MTLLTRDAEDIIEANIRFHLNSGVDFIIATDVGSMDKTPEILEKYQKKGVLALKRLESNEFNQSNEAEILSEMAKKAVREFEATHVFHGNAHEFWLSSSGSLKDNLPCDNEVFYPKMVQYVAPLSFKSEEFEFNKLNYTVNDQSMEGKAFMPATFIEDAPIQFKNRSIDSLFIHNFSIKKYNKHTIEAMVKHGTAAKNVVPAHIKYTNHLYLLSQIPQLPVILFKKADTYVRQIPKMSVLGYRQAQSSS
jgi:hypothetical protein